LQQSADHRFRVSMRPAFRAVKITDSSGESELSPDAQDSSNAKYEQDWQRGHEEHSRDGGVAQFRPIRVVTDRGYEYDSIDHARIHANRYLPSASLRWITPTAPSMNIIRSRGLKKELQSASIDESASPMSKSRAGLDNIHMCTAIVLDPVRVREVGVGLNLFSPQPRQGDACT